MPSETTTIRPPELVPSGRSPIWAKWVTPDWVNRPFDQQRSIDPFGHRIHAWLAAFACLCIAGPTSLVELGAIPVLCASVIRFHRHWRTLPRLFLQPLALVILAWTAVAAASFFWTLGPRDDWVDEFGSLRFGYLLIAIWPVADRRTLLLAALALGFAIGQLTQLGHGLGSFFDIDWMTWNRLPGRNSGWWDPVVGGSLLVAVLGLHLPAALWGTGRWRALGAAGAGVTVIGILATGTRGAWLAAAGLVALSVLIAAWRVRPRKKLTMPALALFGVLAISSVVAWLTIGDQLRARFDAGRQEITGALERKEFQSDTGARLLMNWWAIEATLARPLSGVGMGGYDAWTRAHVIEQDIDPATRNYHAHAHNALLQAAATLGVPGLLLALAFVALSITGSARRQPGDGPPGYADGPCFALIGFLLISAFDSVHVNSQTAALLAVLVLFALQQRPFDTHTKRVKAHA